MSRCLLLAFLAFIFWRKSWYFCFVLKAFLLMFWNLKIMIYQFSSKNSNVTCKTYNSFPTISSSQQAWNTCVHNFSVILKFWADSSKIEESGFWQVLPSIFPRYVLMPFLQQNLLPRLLKCFFSFRFNRFFNLRFLLIRTSGLLLTTQTLTVNP